MKYPIPPGAVSINIEPIFEFETTNLPPEVNAGNDIEITLPVDTVRLIGNAKDPDGVIRSIRWTQLEGPGISTIISPEMQETDVVLPAAGYYEFAFGVWDNAGVKSTDLVTVTVKEPAPTTSIPKIVGFGSRALGGEGKQVFHVKTKAEFMAALGSNRIIQFDADVSMTARVSLRGYSYMTIDANGHDVTIDNGNNGDGISFDGSGCHHNILIGVRVINAGNDGINVINGAHDIVIMNCSAYYNRDGNIDIAGGYNVSLIRNILGAGHPQDGGNGANLNTGREVSGWQNAFLFIRERGPMVHASYTPIGSPNADYRGNLVWGWEGYGASVAYGAKMDYVNNYLASSENPENTVDNRGGWGNEPVGKLFASGNVGLNANADSNSAEFPIPDWAKLPVMTACDAAKEVLQYAGPGKRNAVELSWFNAVKLDLCK